VAAVSGERAAGRQAVAVGSALFWLAATSVLLAATTPKILIGEIPVYASEILLAVGPIFLLFRWPDLLPNVRILPSAAFVFLFYVFVLLGSTITATISGDYSAISFMLLVKRFLYHFVLLVVAQNGVMMMGREHATQQLDLFFKALLFAGLVPLLFSVGELLAFGLYGWMVPMTNLTDYSLDSYSPTLFAVGFTGRAIGPEGFYLVGSSSINYGILNGALSALSLLYFQRTRRGYWLVLMLIYGLGVALTLSSTAFIVYALALVTAFVLAGNVPLRALLLIVGGVLFVVTVPLLPIDRDRFYALGDMIQTLQALLAGGGADASNVSLRIETFERALGGVARYPHIILTGAGLDDFTAYVMNADDPLIESFFLDALVNAGAIGFGALVLSFFALGQPVLAASRMSGGVGMAGRLVILMTPGLLFSNTISGNSVQSEFVGGLLFLTLSACVAAQLRSDRSPD
jgi:hypothetical protein